MQHRFDPLNLGNAPAQHFGAPSAVARSNIDRFRPVIARLQSEDSSARANAVAFLRDAAFSSELNAKAIAAAGGIAQLVDLFRSQHDAQIHPAIAETLSQISRSGSNVAPFVDPGLPLDLLCSPCSSSQRVWSGVALMGIMCFMSPDLIMGSGILDTLLPQLRHLLQCGESSAGILTHSAECIKGLAKVASTQILRADIIPPLVNLLHVNHVEILTEAAGAIKLLTYNSSNDVLEAIAAAGTIPKMLALLENPISDDDINEEAAGLLLNMSLMGYAHDVITARGIPVLVRHLSPPVPEVQRRAAAALMHLATTGQDASVKIVKAGAVRPLVKLLESRQLLVLASGNTALCALLKNCPEQMATTISASIPHSSLPGLVHLMGSGHDLGCCALAEAAAVLRSIAGLQNHATSMALVRAGYVEGVRKLLSRQQHALPDDCCGPSVYISIMNTFTELMRAAGTMSAVIAAGGIDVVQQLLQHTGRCSWCPRHGLALHMFQGMQEVMLAGMGGDAQQIRARAQRAMAAGGVPTEAGGEDDDADDSEVLRRVQSSPLAAATLAAAQAMLQEVEARQGAGAAGGSGGGGREQQAAAGSSRRGAAAVGTAGGSRERHAAAGSKGVASAAGPSRSQQQASSSNSSREAAAATAGGSSGTSSSADVACAMCGSSSGAAGGRLHRCSGCRAVRYCGASCQKAHWKQHKAACMVARGK